ncbi:hypothetical protein GCM10012320_08380 [Sinomonas cellulolyticus]|uniref:Type IV secretory system conjugative DNA transfer family protein n=1 Tax=Sinomonas cellulolyticus TaxID=2801916 RepID=A0ABS1K466_9MICC|nr:MULTISPECIES: type IV secretory system conjugative DNA transfer family protein [Sinomonas]MBL0706298.1 type IV secretory system conjugative DNA transfer family protein [Sinomonas cellulolyticus]GHG43934.1 hypothetical protein GCM10012320_08380 [Sinomonas sp. KCTC 49339]
MSKASLEFHSLYLARPFDFSAVLDTIRVIATSSEVKPIAFEFYVDRNGTRYHLGCRPSDLPRLRRALEDHLPGSVVHALSAPRLSPDRARRVDIRPASLMLSTDRTEAFTLALLSSANRRFGDGESVVLQVVLGARRPARILPAQLASTQSSILDALVGTPSKVTASERRSREAKAGEPGFVASIRIGVSSPVAPRRQQLGNDVLSALRQLEQPGHRISLGPASARDVFAGRMPRTALVPLSSSEVAALLAWPAGEPDFPAVAPLHPRLCRASPALGAERAFAVSAVPGDTRRIGIRAQDALLHSIFYGPTGSGKSTALEALIASDLKAGRPVVVLDPKAQLALGRITRLIPKARLDDVVILDAADARPVGFNPLAPSPGRDPDVIVDGILAVFKAIFAEGWGPRTEDIYSATLRTLARTSTADDPATLIDITRLLTDPTYRRVRTAKVVNDPGLAGFWAWYEELSPGGQSAAIAPPMNKLRQLLLRPALVRMLGQPHPAFHLRDVFRQNKIVLVPLNEGLIGEGTASLLGSLVVAELWQATQERARERQPMDRPGMVFVDEAHRFLHLPVSLADALNQSRSLGVGWHLATQYPSQFPTEIRDAVATNARNKIVYKQERKDAKYFADLAGSLTVEDFTALERHQVYANLASNGAPTGWASLATLGPQTEISTSQAVISRSRELYAATQRERAPQDEERIEAAVPPAAPIGRKRRVQP